MWCLGSARDPAAHWGERYEMLGGEEERGKGDVELRCSGGSQEVLAASVGIGSLLTGRLGSRPRRHCVLECGSVLREELTIANEGL